MTLKVLLAPSGFKESLSAEEVTEALAAGVLRAWPDAHLLKAPLVDGGEGFTKTLVAVTGGTLHELTVTGPVGEPVASHFGFLGGSTGRKTAVLEMAAAAGLRLVPRNARDPLQTTTYGVGELIKAALDAGAERILVGCGDSGTNDGGAGMAQALGVRLRDAGGREIGRGGRELLRLHQIDLSRRDPRLAHTQIDVACNWHNLLCGPRGVARVFGPQKGASPADVELLAKALDHYADIIAAQIGCDIRFLPGSGASGGLGAGLLALLGAKLHPRYDIVMHYLQFDELLQEADLVITAEGSLDEQTPAGKIPAEVARRAKQRGLPVIAFAGSLGRNVEVNFAHGIDSFTSILQAPCTLSEAIAQAPMLVTQAAERALRMVRVGMMLKQVPFSSATPRLAA
ncbi:MAG: glycerate kinase [candidate division KSB1 bacterium]|nr:glycerate kinase [candidate division KSB1 bacterium]MDZ7274533.1 glycerate kinase [candidate division KSB1 bacterium]MDZ7284806.1 glycerate kinase [candidate division KSB1 bacterium]MDZ7297774.1 glycerate kinase [candidate division KSB1 bacterium]MDZ7306437.1 glycerate kinase [candidate division KSB1 bacterium]